MAECFIERAWGKAVADKIKSRRLPRPRIGSPEHIDQLRARLRMNDALAERWVNNLLGTTPPIVRWAPASRERRREARAPRG